MNTYTLAIRNVISETFTPAPGIPCNMTKLQAEALSVKARGQGIDCVAYNIAAE